MIIKRFVWAVISLFMFGTVFAAVLERPQWKDICPAGFEDAVYNDVQWYWPESTKTTQTIYNYWAKRRVDFENSLVECDFMLPAFKETCYENLKSKQVLDNELYNNRVQHKIISGQMWKDSRKMSNPIMINTLTR